MESSISELVHAGLPEMFALVDVVEALDQMGGPKFKNWEVLNGTGDALNSRGTFGLCENACALKFVLPNDEVTTIPIPDGYAVFLVPDRLLPYLDEPQDDMGDFVLAKREMADELQEHIRRFYAAKQYFARLPAVPPDMRPFWQNMGEMFREVFS